jgi:hypothetical protein
MLCVQHQGGPSPPPLHTGRPSSRARSAATTANCGTPRPPSPPCPVRGPVVPCWLANPAWRHPCMHCVYRLLMLLMLSWMLAFTGARAAPNRASTDTTVSHASITVRTSHDSSDDAPSYRHVMVAFATTDRPPPGSISGISLPAFRALIASPVGCPAAPSFPSSFLSPSLPSP